MVQKSVNNFKIKPVKSLIKLGTITVLAFMVTSCGESVSNSGSTTTDPKNSKVVSCFEAFDYDLEKFLTKEDVLVHVDPAKHSEVKHEKVGESGQYASLTYQYKSDRTITLTMGSISQEVPDRNTFAIKGVSFYNGSEEEALANFETSYKKISDAELNTINERLEKEYADKPKEQLEQAKKFAQARKNLAYEPVAGLGTAAYWHSVTVAGINTGVDLKVLVGTMEFNILVKVSADNAENLKVAKALAEAVIKKCS